MRQRIIRYGVIVVLLASLLLSVQVLEARKGDWSFGDARYFTIDLICRDGAVLSAVYNPPNISTGSSIDLGARLYTNTSTPLPDPDVGLSRRPSAMYGPMLAPTQIFPMPDHAEDDLFPADIDGSGIIEPDENFDVYMTGGQLLWSRRLPVGALVVITHSGVGFNWEYVEDCYLNQFTVDGGSTTPIDSGHLQVNFGVIPPADLVYRLDDAPASGDLLLNGSPLNVGDNFTQADIDGNDLTYAHDGSLTASDVFTFSVAGTTRASIRTNGTQSNGDSYDPSLSGSGGLVAFQSSATNLVSGDTNTYSGYPTSGTCPDIFLHNLSTLTTTRVSVSYAGAQSNNASYTPSLSSNGSNLSFSSLGSNLMNAADDCWVYSGDLDGARDVFWRTTFLNNPLLRFSCGPERFGRSYQGDYDSYNPSISPDGIYVAYESDATNLLQYRNATSMTVGTLDNNGFRDIYHHYNTESALVSRASGFSGALANGASYAPSISGDGGRFVAFYSYATNLAGADANGAAADIFVRDTSPPYSTTLVSRATNNVQGNAASYTPSISEDGRYVAFYSLASNLVSGDTNTCYSWTDPGECPDIFVRDRDADADGIFDETDAVSTTRVSLATGGAQANGSSYNPVISADGRYVAFYSYASNLVSGDSNACTPYLAGTCPDIFVHDRLLGVTTRVSVAHDGAQATGGGSYDPSISADGEYVAFESDATNLIGAGVDSNAMQDIFVHYAGFSSPFPIAIIVQSPPDVLVYLPVVIK